MLIHEILILISACMLVCRFDDSLNISFCLIISMNFSPCLEISKGTLQCRYFFSFLGGG